MGEVNNIFKAVLIGSIFSIGIECAQIIYPSRWTDIDDVILNTLGTAVGYEIFTFVKRRYEVLKHSRSYIRLQGKNKVKIS